MQDLFLMQQSENNAKQQRRHDGLSALNQWNQERSNQIKNRIKNNIEIQVQNEKEAASLKQSMNPWQRVCANVEFSASGTTVGGKDISRMKAAMLSRKTDLTQKQNQAPML